MMLKAFLAVLVMGLFGCTKHNPLSCCNSAVQCASFGIDQITGCEGLNVCDPSGTCVSPQCATSAECTSPDAPICSNQLCVASCSNDDSCTSSTLPHCSAQGTCVECVDSTQCPADAHVCNNGTCVSSPPDGGTSHVCPHELLFQRGGLFNGGQVIRVSLDDFVEHPLGTGSPADEEGAYSPDGTKIVLVRGGTTLWVMDLDGGNAHQIDTQAALFTSPHWSPDGTRVAYAAAPTAGGNGAIWIASVGGTAGMNITPLYDAEGPLEWSPDGSKIAFASQRTGNSDVFTMNPDGSSQFNVTNRTHDDGLDGIHWSPDGQQLTFTGFNSIWRMNADGSNGQSLTIAGFGQPTWGSNALIYFVKDPGGAGQLYVTNSNGVNQHALTTDTHINLSPVLSPDATKIAWARSETGTNFQIYVANADGSNPVNVTTGGDRSPRWRPCAP